MPVRSRVDRNLPHPRIRLIPLSCSPSRRFQTSPAGYFHFRFVLSFKAMLPAMWPTRGDHPLASDDAAPRLPIEDYTDYDRAAWNLSRRPVERYVHSLSSVQFSRRVWTIDGSSPRFKCKISYRAASLSSGIRRKTINVPRSCCVRTINSTRETHKISSELRQSIDTSLLCVRTNLPLLYLQIIVIRIIVI